MAGQSVPAVQCGIVVQVPSASFTFAASMRSRAAVLVRVVRGVVTVTSATALFGSTTGWLGPSWTS